MSLLVLLSEGGPILFVLLFVSIFSLAMVILKTIDLRKMKLDERFSLEEMDREIQQRGPVAVATDLHSHPSPLARMSARTLELCVLDTQNLSREERERELELSGADEVRRMETGLGAIAVAAHLSPLLGLLGTVMGMISAFHSLEQAGMRAEPSVLAGGIWEALLTTAFGLMIAIPLLAVHHYFESKIDDVRHRMELLASALLKRYRPGDLDVRGTEFDSGLRSSLQ